MTHLGRRLLAALLLGLLLGRLLLGPRSAPWGRLGLLLIKGNGAGTKTRDRDQIGGSDPESDSQRQQHRDARVASAAFDFAQKSLGTPAGRCPFEGETRQVPRCPDVFADEPKKSLGVHHRELATSGKSALAHSRVGVFVDGQTPWRCTWSRMGDLRHGEVGGP